MSAKDNCQKVTKKGALRCQASVPQIGEARVLTSSIQNPRQAIKFELGQWSSERLQARMQHPVLSEAA